MPYAGKIFCIGAFRTGTSSLARGLRLLGYSVCESHEKLRYGLKQYEAGNTDMPYQQLLGRFDCLAQQPVAVQFRLLYTHYPGAKFIFTHRDPDEWLFSRATLIMNTWFFLNRDRDKEFCPQEALRWYNKHTRKVRGFFEDHPNASFLEMDITKGDGWDKLCPFLECEPPNEDFPHANGSEFLLQRILRKRKQQKHGTANHDT
jgi:hypothetical protein